jgi:hypothetical protein
MTTKICSWLKLAGISDLIEDKIPLPEVWDQGEILMVAKVPVKQPAFLLSILVSVK